MTRRQGRNNLHLTQPHAAYVYQKMNGVDRHHQLRLTYAIGRDSKKAWKYIFYFLVNCATVNAFIIYNMILRRRHSKKRFTHLDFRCELGHELISGFCGRKRKGAEVPQQIQNEENYHGHESVRLNTRRRCRVHLRRKQRKETVFGCVCVMYIYAKMGVIRFITPSRNTYQVIGRCMLRFKDKKQ